MIGRELKARLIELRREHRSRSIERAPLPLLTPTTSAQIVTGIASNSDVDSDRMSFARNSLSWPALGQLPLLLRHDVNKVVGRVLALDYSDDGKLQVRAEVDDETARRMPAFSIAATVHAAEVRDTHSPSGYHAIVTRAVIDEITLTDRPSNAAALVLSRRDVGSLDRGYDAIFAALGRVAKGLEAYAAAMPPLATPPPEPPQYLIKAAPAYIIGGIPRPPRTAHHRARPTQFSALVGALNERFAP